MLLLNMITHSFAEFYQYDFLWQALLGMILLSLASGLLSPMIVTKNLSFMGAALGHSILLSLGIAALFLSAETVQNSELTLYLTLTVITVGLILFLAYLTQGHDTPPDSVIGIFYSTTMALGVILYQISGKDQSLLMTFLFGNILMITPLELGILLGLTVMIGLILFFGRYWWPYYLYDTQGAKMKGIPITLLHYTLFMMVGLLILVAVKLAGTILVNAFLITPGLFALKRAKNLPQVFIISVLVGLVSALIGLYLANLLSLPPGPSLAVVSSLLLLMPKR